MHTEIEGTQNVREALGSILDQNRGRWQKFIYTILKNEADSEDVVHDAVRQVLARGIPFISEEQARMYLGRVIGNVAFSRYKDMKRNRRRQMPMDEQLLMTTDRISPYDALEQAERSVERERMLRKVREGLEHLPSKQYEALRLTILESSGSSIRDVGMNNGIPYSTLRHRSKQGLRSLRRFLLGCGKATAEYRRLKNKP
jgi:RNA polymerase sigma factor (sigma-70 family)